MLQTTKALPFLVFRVFRVCVCVCVLRTYHSLRIFFFARVKSSSSSVVINGASYARTSGRYAKMTESTSDT